MTYNGCIVFWKVGVLRVGSSEGVFLTVDLTDTSFMKASSVVQLNGHVHKHFLWVWTLRIWGVDFFFFLACEELDFVSLGLCAISWTRRFILKNAGCLTIRKLFCYVYSQIFLFAFLHWKRVNNHWFFFPLILITSFLLFALVLFSSAVSWGGCLGYWLRIFFSLY